MQHKQDKAFALSVVFSLAAFFAALLPKMVSAESQVNQGTGPSVAQPTPDLSNAQVQGYYFYSKDCSHCMDILQTIVLPTLDANPGQIDLRLIELGEPINYEASLRVEEYFNIKPAERDIPITVLGDKIYIGDQENRDPLEKALERALSGELIKFPVIEGVDPEALIVSTPVFEETNPEICSPENPDACAPKQPIYAAYFYTVGCKDCDRAVTDLAYLRSKYPQLVVEEFNRTEEAALALWMAERAGIDPNFGAPALFIGDKAWIGPEEILPQDLDVELQALSAAGSEAFWLEYDETQGQSALAETFRSLGKFGVLLAGLVDGLNPCAFATIIFFVSYLTLSGKKGREILITGVLFTLGVFVAYLLIGLGFYKVLDLVKSQLSVVGRIINILTIGLCLVLAYFSIKDFFKARKGEIGDMALNLPEPLRKRINSTIREGRKASSYYFGAFITGLLISVLELACTGQMYLPVIISVTEMPELRGQAILYLVLYNIMFIIPLIVVFVLAYFGTTSKQFTDFLKKHAPAVKLGLAVVYIGLAVWLILTLI